MPIKILGILKPEYFFQPKVLLRRLWPWYRLPEKEFIDYILPWGMDIRLRAQEHQSVMLWGFGVFDLPVTEALWRLTDPGETAIDAGANAGYMSSILLARVKTKAGGRVYAFEPHPEVFQELEYNSGQWQKNTAAAQIMVKRSALSDTRGQAKLLVPDQEILKRNSGLSTLADISLSDTFIPAEEKISVATDYLDNLFADTKEIGVLKVDVEGYEEHVLKGAKDLLKGHKIRDIVFEENYGFPSSAATYLADFGYRVFIITKSFFGPKLLEPKRLRPEALRKIYERKMDSISLLATSQPQRALERFKEIGWLALRKR
jgi:FkbM family methyltransferase